MQLPLLHNPFLNCILNNPNHGKAPFKSTIDQISIAHYDYALVAPPAHILHQWYDPATIESNPVPLKELCYNNEEFIQSHVIRILLASNQTPKSSLSVFSTLNGKELLIKHGTMFPGRGFKRLVNVRVIDVGYVPMFADYFPRGTRLLVLYVDLTLWGASPLSVHHVSPPLTSHRRGLMKKILPPVPTKITFDTLLRIYPLLAKATGDQFYLLLHHNNPKYRVLQTYTKKPVDDIVAEFIKIRDDAYGIVLESAKQGSALADQTHEVIQEVIKVYPDLDWNQLVHEYVETNLYDRVWAQLIIQFRPNLVPSPQYQDISLNQLEMPVFTPWEMDVFHQRVFKAAGCLRDLGDDRHNARQKMEVIESAVDSLLLDNPFMFNADTLIGLLILMVCQAQVPDLEAHLYYIKQFGVLTPLGRTDFLLSNMDAVVYYLKEHGDELAVMLSGNQELWHNFRHSPNNVAEMISNGPEELPPSHSLYSRTPTGESALMLAIKYHQPQIFAGLLYYHPNWFAVEDVLFDRTADTHCTLLMVALEEEMDDICDEIVEFLKINCLKEEQRLYYNLVDAQGRSAGHYLFHRMGLIEKIGGWIDWNLKDCNDLTPLFSLVRCYDHPSYRELVVKVFDCVYAKYGAEGIDFNYHVDNLDNTLLHVIKSDIDALKMLTSSNLINVNQTNSRLMTPLMLYAKYCRTENISAILKVPDLDFLYEDRCSHMNVFDYLGFKKREGVLLTVSALVGHYQRQVGSQVVVLALLMIEDGKEWMVGLCDLANPNSIHYLPLSTIAQIMYLVKRQYPFFSIMVDEDVFWLNYRQGVSGIFFAQRFQLNRVVDQLNVMFSTLEAMGGPTAEDIKQMFFNTTRKISTLDEIEAINQARTLQIADMEQVELSNSQIIEMEGFLKFAVDDAECYHRLLIRLNKLMAISVIKHAELEFSVEQLVGNASAVQVFQVLEMVPVHSRWMLLLDHTSWLEATVADLIVNIHKLLTRLHGWRQLYQEIRQLNIEITRSEESIPVKLEDTSGENGDHQLSRRNTFTVDPIPDDDQDNLTLFFNFANIVENKKLRYKKLVYSKAAKVKQIMAVNQELKLDHELMALAISEYVGFRPRFLQLAMARHTDTTLVHLRRRLVELRVMKKRVQQINSAKNDG